MKRITAILLTIIMMLSAPAAFAKQIETYGDGTKKSMKAETKNGQEYTYYDIFEGATKREDSRDFDRLMRNVLGKQVLVTGQLPYRSQLELWDLFLRNNRQHEIPTWRDKTLYQWITDVNADEHGDCSTNPANLLYASSSAEATELAIRTQVANRYKKYHSSYTAANFKEIKGLKELGFKGPSFFSLNYSIVNNKRWIIAFGSIFYDFELFYIDDGKQLDSAVGSETDIDKLKGRRGFTHTAAQPSGGVSAWAQNSSKKPIKQNVTLTSTISRTLSNSITQTTSTQRSYMIGLDTKIAVSVPFCNVESTLKTSATSTFLSSTTNGSSKSETTSTSYTNTISDIVVPPHTKVQVQMQEADATTSIEYDYPVGITYKVAQYVVYDESESFLAGVFGDAKDTEQSNAFTNLAMRFDHRSSNGYEAVHGNGYPINWSKVNTNDRSFIPLLTNYIPMSITGGKISGTGKTLSLKVYDPVPMSQVSKVTADVDKVTLAKNASANIYDMVNVRAFDSGTPDDPQPMDFYGFDDNTHGRWVVCDKDGNEMSSTILSVTPDGQVKTGEAVGTAYLKYLLDEAMCAYVGDVDEETGVATLLNSSNADIDNQTVIAVEVIDKLADFVGTVQMSGELSCELNETIRIWPELTIRGTDGVQVSSREYPTEWLVDGEVVANGAYKATKPGTHTVQARYGGVLSNEITLTVAAGEAPTGITLDRQMIDIARGKTTQLTASLRPATADASLLSWSSSDESVATVDETGKVSAVGTGVAIITVKAGDVKAECDVYVGIPETGDALGQGRLAIVKGKSFSLGRPGGAEGSWSSADAAVARVTPKGKVFAKALGETKLTFNVSSAKAGASFLGKEVKAGDVIELPVVVAKKGEVVTKLVPESKKLALAPGENYVLIPERKPDKALYKDIYYTSSDNSVAAVDANGLITAKQKGKAVITVVSSSGKLTKVTVEVMSGDELKGVTLNAKKAKISVGEAFQLLPTPDPAGHTYYSVTYKSGKPKVATVDENGLITALKKGKSTITVTMTLTDEDGKPIGKAKSAKFKLTVK